MTIPTTFKYKRLVQVGLASNAINLSTSAAMGHRVQVTMPVDEMNSFFYWQRLAGSARARGRFNSTGFVASMNTTLAGIYSDLDSVYTGLSFSSASLDSATDSRLRSADDESANDLVMAYVLFKCFGSTAVTTLDVVYNLEDACNMVTNSTVSSAISASLSADDAASTTICPGLIDSMFTHLMAAQPMRFFDASGKQVPYLFETNADASGTGSWNLMQGDLIEIPIQFTFAAPVTLNSVRDTDGELSGNTDTTVIVKAGDTFYVRLQLVAGPPSGNVTPTGSIVSTFAGNSVAAYADGLGDAAQFNQPFGNTMDSQGNMYVSDLLNQCIRKITPDGTVTTVAGIPGVAGYADGAAASAQFMYPAGLAFDAAGNLYICDAGNNALRMLSPSGIVSTISINSGLNNPAFCTVNPSDPTQVYVSNQIANEVVSINVSSGVVTVLASGFYSMGIKYYAGSLYVVYYTADANSVVTGTGINKITLPVGQTPASTTSMTLSGSLTQAFGIDILANGTMYVVDTIGNCIYRVTQDGTMTLIAGTGTAGYLDGPAASAEFYAPCDITHDSAGNLYVTGYVGPNIRKITL